MDWIVYLLLALAGAAIVFSIAGTVKLFKGFTADSTETNDERIARLKRYRTRMIVSYAAAVVMITAAALIKLI